jgi:baculoviral IAP repeat-containing protein 6
MGKEKTCAVRSCCAEGRAIAIFEALGSLDRQYLKERNTADSRVMANVKKNGKRSASNSVGPGGTGYGTGQRPTATGATRRGKGKLEDVSTSADVLISNWDKMLVSGLTTLTALLPEPYAENPQVYDMLPHPSIGHLVSLSL